MIYLFIVLALWYVCGAVVSYIGLKRKWNSDDYGLTGHLVCLPYWLSYGLIGRFLGMFRK